MLEHLARASRHRARRQLHGAHHDPLVFHRQKRGRQAHEADRQHHREHREHAERAQQNDRDRQRGDQRGAPVLQEHQHHDEDERDVARRCPAAMEGVSRLGGGAGGPGARRPEAESVGLLWRFDGAGCRAARIQAR